MTTINNDLDKAIPKMLVTQKVLSICTFSGYILCFAAFITEDRKPVISWECGKCELDKSLQIYVCLIFINY